MPDTVSYIYVIAPENGQACKIGYSGDPTRRLRQLQTGQSQPLVLHYQEAMPSSVVRLMEAAIHKTNRHRKVSGEWYALSVEDAIAEVRLAVIQFSDDIETRSRHNLF